MNARRRLEGPRSVCSTIHAFVITNTGIGYTCSIFAEKEKTDVHGLTHKS